MWSACTCRCMAISAAVFVGGIEPWKEALIEKAKSLSVGPGDSSKTDVGPLISPEARARAERLVQSGADEVMSIASHVRVYKDLTHFSAAGSAPLAPTGAFSKPTQRLLLLEPAYPLMGSDVRHR